MIFPIRSSYYYYIFLNAILQVKKAEFSDNNKKGGIFVLDSIRLRNRSLFDKIVSPEEAADLIKDGMNVATGGFTPSGYPKLITIALAKQIRDGKKCRINLWTGASVGKEIEESLAAVDGIAGRVPYYAASNRSMQKKINERKIDYVDIHLSHFGQQVDYGFFGQVDIAIIEAVAITEDGHLVLGPSVGNVPVFVKHAKKVLVEINLAQPLDLEGMHDIYIAEKPPCRREIPIYQAGDRIGSPYVECGLDKIAGIVESNIPDQVRDLEPPDEKSKRIAELVIEFLHSEQKKGLLPQKMLPLQSGVGSIANAVLAGFKDSDYEGLEMYSEILQDAVFDLIDLGKVKFASGCAFTPSPYVMKKFRENPQLYRKSIVLRPLDISNHPEVIRRIGSVAMNTPLEFDFYGHANSSHGFGSYIMNGIGGSGDYMRNGFVSIFATESTAKGGAISRVVPMVTHADHTEHDTMIFVTEQGLADVRGLAPHKRARLIIEKCAHPDYRPILTEYLNWAEKKCIGHVPHDLAKVFDMHIKFEETGSMK